MRYGWCREASYTHSHSRSDGWSGKFSWHVWIFESGYASLSTSISRIMIVRTYGLTKLFTEDVLDLHINSLH